MAENINHTFGTLSSAPDGSITEHIFGYISTIVVDIKYDADQNENSITNSLCKTLEFKKNPSSPYYFHHQNIESDKENTSTDFAVFGTFAYAQENDLDIEESLPLVKFEAKRLSSSIPKKREKEYVIGEYEHNKQVKNSGGIERFKNCRHGNDVVNACLIGYVQSDTFSIWREKINEWISAEISLAHDSTLSWDDGDILTEVSLNSKLAVYYSTAKRVTGDIINLRHLWINSA